MSAVLLIVTALILKSTTYRQFYYPLMCSTCGTQSFLCSTLSFFGFVVTEIMNTHCLICCKKDRTLKLRQANSRFTGSVIIVLPVLDGRRAGHMRWQESRTYEKYHGIRWLEIKTWQDVWETPWHQMVRDKHLTFYATNQKTNFSQV